MYELLFNYFLDTLSNALNDAQEAIATAPDAYALAGVSLAMTGVTEASVYQAMPVMNARTVRRVLAGRKDSVRMCMSSRSGTEGVHMDSIENGVLVEIQQQAEKVKVRGSVAMSAVTRYLNSPERVRKVLQDIQALQEAHCKVWNPTGLFTRLMRSGEDVRLPDRVIQAREKQQVEKMERESKPVPKPGVLVKLYGEVCEILSVTRQFALVRTSIDDIQVSLDSLRFA